ncbi:MAG: family 10 glycosylhydrolase, partial [Verrucomicrobiae bacterium]|nr:family 10 glycosylhydrolase [Verrucomicrobiae bacterium]
MRRFSITKHRRLCNPLAYFPAAVVLVIATLTGWSSAFAVEEKPPLPRWRNLSESEAPSVPEPRREFRGVWIATVYNLDWPSKPGLPVETQQAELLDILDRAAALHLNAIVLQVRTMCDAFYESPLEPWSYYLMGELGQAPEPFWDPLAFAVEAAHQRGLELHAWLNPFRATTAEYGDVMPANHVSSQYPWLTRTSGRHLWLDPSSEFVRNRFLTVAFDIVNRYDIDAIHMDDYFYPYPAKGEEPGLDDEENWQRYRYGEVLATGEEPMDRNEWRRELVNNLIEELYHDIKRTKPWVKLGISPFGIWRPG